MGQQDRSPKAAGQTELKAEAPKADALTAYDEAHFAVYLSLLHASAEGASDAEMCRDILGIDPDSDPIQATEMLRSHLDRARWLSTAGRQRVLEY